MFVVREKIDFSVNVTDSNFQMRIALSLPNLLGFCHSSNLLAVQQDGGVIKAHTSNPSAVFPTPSKWGAEKENWEQRTKTSHILFWITGTARYIQSRQYLPLIMACWSQDVQFYFWRWCFPCKQLGRAQFCFLLTYLFSPVLRFLSSFMSQLNLPAPERVRLKKQ